MSKILRRAFFFDRDGTLTSPVYRYDFEHYRWLDGAAISLEELNVDSSAGEIVEYVQRKEFLPIVITNQPDFLKSDILLRVYEDITTRMCQELKIPRSHVFECLHKEGHSLPCECRKPKPGLIYMAAGLHNIDLQNSWFVGDSWVDIAAASAAGITNTIFLRRPPIEGKQEGNIDSYERLRGMGITPKHVIPTLDRIKDIV